MVRGGDLHCVDVRAGDEFAKIFVSRAVRVAVEGVHHLFALGALCRVDVAYSHHLHLRIPQKSRHVVGALDAQTDHAERDAFRGGHEPRSAQGSVGDELPRANRPSGGGSFEKVTAGCRVFHTSDLACWIKGLVFMVSVAFPLGGSIGR